MGNYLLMKESEELKELSKKLGFSKSYFLGDLNVINPKTKKELLKQSKNNKITLFKPQTEDMLRFALEKSSVDIVMGMEMINLKDSVHFVRGGLDQITCRIAKEKGKVIAFSFSDILNSKNRAKLLARMMFNIKLCKKYGVKIIFSNFSSKKEEMRSAKDLKAFFDVLSMGRKK